jgi:pyridoxine kinase
VRGCCSVYGLPGEPVSALWLPSSTWCAIAVVHGYVGNRCATFPLQLHGIEVDCLNSVQLSNHTGYGEFRGQVLSGDDLTALLEGLKMHGFLDEYSHLLTGYIGSESFLRRVVALVDEMRASRSVSWVCDPVLGDHGVCYVPESLVRVYRDLVIPRASILTPNQFEAELLSGRSVTSLEQALLALNDLHLQGVPTVIMTSSELPPGQDATMLLVGSCSWEAASDDASLWPEGSFGVGPHAEFAITIPKLRGAFTGTGDLTASLLLARVSQEGGATRLPSVCLQVLRSLRAVVKRTSEWMSSERGAEWATSLSSHVERARASGVGPRAKVPPAELRLVQSRFDLLEPPEDDALIMSVVVGGGELVPAKLCV